MKLALSIVELYATVGALVALAFATSFMLDWRRGRLDAETQYFIQEQPIAMIRIVCVVFALALFAWPFLPLARRFTAKRSQRG